MDKPKYPNVVRTWKVERIRKPKPPAGLALFPDSNNSCQFSEGFCTLSITSTSSGVLADSSFRPRSSIAVKTDGAAGCDGGAVCVPAADTPPAFADSTSG